MESVCNIETHKYFNVSENDFDKFQNIFSRHDIRNQEDAVDYIKMDENILLDRIYSDVELKSIFDLHAEYTGLDKEIAKDKVSNLSKRRKAEDELKEFIKSKGSKKLSIKSAKELVKVLEAFDSHEFSHND